MQGDAPPVVDPGWPLLEADLRDMCRTPGTLPDSLGVAVGAAGSWNAVATGAVPSMGSIYLSPR